MRKELRRKYGVSEAASRNYVNAAYELGGRELVKSLNTLRMESSVGSDEVAERIRGLAQSAEEAEQFVAAAMAWRAYEANRARKDKLWHLDKISPLLGLESRENRSQLVAAVRDGAHLLTDEQRQELLDALSESEDEDESVTTTLEATR